MTNFWLVSRKRCLQVAAISAAVAGFNSSYAESAVVAAKFSFQAGDVGPPATPGTYNVVQTSSPQSFNNPGGNAADISLKIDGVTLPWGVEGVTLATTAEAGAGNDNFATVYNGSGATWVSTVDHTPAAPTATPPTPSRVSEQTSATAVAYFKYADGYFGGQVAADGTVAASGSITLPTGGALTKGASGRYHVSGLGAGHVLGITNGNGAGGAVATNYTAATDSWEIGVVSIEGVAADQAFSFLFVPTSNTEVFAGLINQDGTVATQNDGLIAAGGATVVKGGNGLYTVQVGDGSVVNPSNAVMLLTGGNFGNAGDQLMRYNPVGNGFEVRLADLPNQGAQDSAFQFMIVSTPVPEPTAIALLTPLCLGLLRRSKRSHF